MKKNKILNIILITSALILTGVLGWLLMCDKTTLKIDSDVKSSDLIITAEQKMYIERNTINEEFENIILGDLPIWPESEYLKEKIDSVIFNSWKIYNNEEIGVMIFFPNDWSVADNSNQKQTSIDIGPENSELGEYFVGFEGLVDLRNIFNLREGNFGNQKKYIESFVNFNDKKALLFMDMFSGDYIMYVPIDKNEAIKFIFGSYDINQTRFVIKNIEIK